MLWVADLAKNAIGPGMNWIKVIDRYESSFHMSVACCRYRIVSCRFADLSLRLGNDGTRFYLMTNEKAPHYKIITIDLADSSFAYKDLIPEDKDAKLETADFVNGDYLALVYKKNVSLCHRVHDHRNLLTLYLHIIISHSGQGRALPIRQDWKEAPAPRCRLCRFAPGICPTRPGMALRNP